MAKESRKFDIRTLERFLRDDVISGDEYEAYLQELPDVSDKAEAMDSEFVEDVLADEEEQEEEQEEEENTEDEESS